jgi:hypothetical protein
VEKLVPDEAYMIIVFEDDEQLIVELQQDLNSEPSIKSEKF